MKIQAKTCNAANYGGTRQQTRYLVIHYTSNRGDTAKNNADYFAREALASPASAHYFVDETEIWASVPETCVAWHCGAKTYVHPTCRNANSIGVEICMNAADGSVREGSITHAAELVRELMQRYQIPVERVLRHHDVTGKDCPAPMVENVARWNAFLDSLKEETQMRYRYYEDMPDWAKPTVSKLVKKGYLKGEGDGVLNLTEDTLKVLVINDRAGVYKA